MLRSKKLGTWKACNLPTHVSVARRSLAVVENSWWRVDLETVIDVKIFI
jgi:hypothetical protein